MAIVYFGRNNNKNQQQIYKAYYADILSQPKIISKAYIGIKNKAKLFYNGQYAIYLKERIHYIEEVNNTLIPPIKEYDTLKFADYKNQSLYNTGYSENVILYIPNYVTEIYAPVNSDSLFQSDDVYDELGTGPELFRYDRVINFQDQTIGGRVNLSNLKYFNNLENMVGAFGGGFYLIGNPIKAPNVKNMHNAYDHCFNISGKIYIGNYVQDASYAYQSAGSSSASGLNLADIKVGIYYKDINLYGCFEHSKIKGNLIINSYPSKEKINHLFFDRKSTTIINVYMPDTKTLTQLNTYLSGLKICHAYSSSGSGDGDEKHIIKDDYIEIMQHRSDLGRTYNVRFYNYIPE